MKRSKQANDKGAWKFVVIGTILIAVAAVAIIGFFLQGQKTVVGSYPEIKNSQVLSCEAIDLPYPFFNLDSSVGSRTKIDIVFENDNLVSINLINTMIYSNAERAQIESEDHHGDMDISFDSLGTDALDARYTINGNEIQMSLYASKDRLNSSTRKYFLINGEPTNPNGYNQNFTMQGFNCRENNQ